MRHAPELVIVLDHAGAAVTFEIHDHALVVAAGAFVRVAQAGDEGQDAAVLEHDTAVGPHKTNVTVRKGAFDTDNRNGLRQ